jgi:hypothetical protein
MTLIIKGWKKLWKSVDRAFCFCTAEVHDDIVVHDSHPPVEPVRLQSNTSLKEHNSKPYLVSLSVVLY